MYLYTLSCYYHLTELEYQGNQLNNISTKRVHSLTLLCGWSCATKLCTRCLYSGARWCCILRRRGVTLLLSRGAGLHGSRAGWVSLCSELSLPGRPEASPAIRVHTSQHTCHAALAAAAPLCMSVFCQECFPHSNTDLQSLGWRGGGRDRGEEGGWGRDTGWI